MSLLGVDLNASAVRAVRGPLGEYPCGEPLDPPRAELPLALYLEGRAPVLAVRVQELFGLDRHPAIAGGRVPLVLELLSPAHRPMQVMAGSQLCTICLRYFP